MNKTKTHKYYFIYMTKNLVNNKCYIGWHATNNLNDNYIGSGRALKRAIKKYGITNFISGIIDFYDYSIILEKEIFWITKMQTMTPLGYNLTSGGDGKANFITSRETKEKLRQSQLNLSKEKRNKISDALRKAYAEKKFSIEEREMMSIRQKGKKHSEESKIKMSDSKKGHMISLETKSKIQQSNKNKKRSEETKRKMSLARKGKNFNKELKCFV